MDILRRYSGNRKKPFEQKISQNTGQIHHGNNKIICKGKCFVK